MVVRYPTHPQPTDINTNTNMALWGHSMGQASYTSGYAFHFPTGQSDFSYVENGTIRGGSINDIISGGNSNWLTEGDVYILEFSFSDTSGKFNLNINSQNIKNQNLESGWSVDNNWVSGQMVLGAYSNGSAISTTVEGRSVAVNDYLSNSDRETIEGYLLTKWGVTLPSTHIYSEIQP